MSPRAGKRGATPSSRRSPRDSRRQGARTGASTAASGVSFWGQPSAQPPAAREVRFTPDPSAMARSLGPPPLPGRESVSEYYFATVYDRAVALAAALATAGGLVTAEERED